MVTVPNLLLISGTGRNTGKTTLACEIIKRFSTEHKITGLKISPHFHGGTESLRPLIKNPGFNIYEETSSTTGKDSSKFLQAGAFRVFYIEVLDDHLKEAFEAFLEVAIPAGPIVCESPALRNHINPGVFFIVDNEANKNKKMEILNWKGLADKWINIENDKTEAITSKISLIENKWIFLNK